MPKFKANVCGIRVATWGTSAKAGNGMPHFLNHKFFGGNTGHATVTVTFPADERGKALIKQYCTDPPIPYEKHIIRVPKAKRGANPLNPQGYGVSDEAIVEEEVYSVNFSWWPEWSGAGYALAPFENDDAKDEREGVPVEYEPKWQELLQPEERVHGGILGSTKMAYGYSTVVHKAGLEAKQIELLDAQAQLQLLEQQQESLEVLNEKLDTKRNKLREISSRKRKMEKKEKLVSNKRAKINALNALKRAVQNNQDPTKVLSTAEQKLLTKILPKWREGRDLKKIDKRIKHNKNGLKALTKDSLEKVSKDSTTIARFSQSEQLLLDRFIPSWREQDIEVTKIRKMLKSLSKQAAQKSESLERQAEKVQQKIDILESELASAGVHEYKVDNANLIKKRELEKLLMYFTNLPINKKEQITIDGDVTAKLDLFTSLAGIAWKGGVIKAHKGKFRHASKSEIELIKSTLTVKLANLKDAKYNEDADQDYKSIRYRRNYLAWQTLYRELNLLMDTRSPKHLKIDQNTKIKSELQEKLDNAFWMINRPWYGPNGFVKDRKNLTYAEAVALFSFVRAEMANAKYKMVDQELPLGRFNQSDYAHFLTRGRLPDAEIRLPVDMPSNASNSHENGMNVEAMLKEIQRITKYEKFDLHTNNCSSTVSKVLEAGATNPYLKSQFQNRALGAIANPQMVINNAASYQAALQSPKDSWYKRLQRFNPIERLGGWCLNKLMVEKNVSVPTKIAAGLLACVTWSYAAVKTLVKKFVNPLKSFKELRRFASYANSTKSLGFKIAAAVAYVPAMAVLAPFAGVQYGIEKAVQGVGRFFRKITGSKPKTKPPSYYDFTPEQLKEHEHKQRLFNQATKEVLSRLAITEITAQTTDEAILQFEKLAMEMTVAYANNEFKDNQYPIVILSRETAFLFEKEIEQKRRTHDPLEVAKATELEKKYRSFQNSNHFFLTNINNLVQKKFAEKLSEFLQAQPVDVEAINAGAEQARLDFSRDSNVVPKSKPDSQGAIKRQRMRQAAFAQFTDERDMPQKIDTENAKEPDPLKPSPSK